MAGTTAELRTLLARLDAYVLDPTVDDDPPSAPTAAEAMATYAMAARLVEADLGRARPHRDLSVHRDVLTATQRMLQAALAAQDGESVAAARPSLRLVEDGARS